MQQVAREEKKLLKGEKVARIMKSCQKVAEQLVESPTCEECHNHVDKA